MPITIGRVLSLLVALAYLAGAVVAEQRLSPAIVVFSAVVLLPLGMIWFPDEVGSFTGYVGRGGYIDSDTPPYLVSALGWFFLVGLPCLLWFIWS